MKALPAGHRPAQADFGTSGPPCESGLADREAFVIRQGGSDGRRRVIRCGSRRRDRRRGPWVAQHLVRRAVGDDRAFADDVRPVADVQRFAHVVVGDQHADAPPRRWPMIALMSPTAMGRRRRRARRGASPSAPPPERGRSPTDAARRRTGSAPSSPRHGRCRVHRAAVRSVAIERADRGRGASPAPPACCRDSVSLRNTDGSCAR
jgi:hypothetical protein